MKFHCPSCGRRVSAPESFAGTLVECPECLAQFDAPGIEKPVEVRVKELPQIVEAQSSPAAQRKPNKLSKSNTNLIGWMVICGIVIAFIIASVGDGDGARKRGNEIDAIIFAQDAVRSHLRWPHDADFGLSFASNDKNKWGVAGTVTAKNALGASLTHEWQVSLRWNPRTQEWKCTYCKIGDEVYVRN